MITQCLSLILHGVLYGQTVLVSDNASLTTHVGDGPCKKGHCTMRNNTAMSLLSNAHHPYALASHSGHWTVLEGIPAAHEQQTATWAADGHASGHCWSGTVVLSWMFCHPSRFLKRSRQRRECKMGEMISTTFKLHTEKFRTYTYFVQNTSPK